MSSTAPESLPALGICLEEYEYPYPVRFLPLTNDLQQVSMAYMDVLPGAEPNGKTVVLMHGKAFGGYYFRNVIEALAGSGYRVVVPDQIGWGKSPKPDIHYSFQLLAANTAALLDHLGVGEVVVLGHSTGGMTAVRFTLMNPDRVTHLVLEDPLGLVDYRTGIPPQSEETLYDHEVHWTDPATIRGYVKGYFMHPDPKVWEPLADILVRVTLSADYPRWARAAALTFQMIYQQPVRYEYPHIAPPVLLIVGAEDHVVPLGQYATPAELARLGDFTGRVSAVLRQLIRLSPAFSMEVQMPVSSGETQPVEVGPPPYYHRSDCNICRKQDGLKTGSVLLDVPVPGGYIVESEHFLAEHAPLQESSAGTVILEARRHVLDFGEMTPAELAEFGSIAHRLVPAIKAATGVQRVYLLAVMERAPHFHLWFVPKKDGGGLRGVDYLAQRPPLTASFSEAEAMSIKIREQFEQS